MILSVSRRTDIPNYYFDWFCNRLREGYLYVRNPMNERQVSHIDLSPEVIDCIVFWTKNPAAMMERLSVLEKYPYYVQFTLTGYGKDVELGLPDKKTVLPETFRRLSRIIGKKRVIWRYDPILFHPAYTPAWHLNTFEDLAQKLEGYTERVVISFVDSYAKIRKSLASLQVRQPSDDEILQFSAQLATIADKHGLWVEACSEALDLSQAGIRRGCCIDSRLIEEITGRRILAGKDKNQRKECGCAESVEVGAYNTCKNGCRYCYANFSAETVRTRTERYHPDSPLLCGELHPEDKVTIRKMKSLAEDQLTLFDVPVK